MDDQRNLSLLIFDCLLHFYMTKCGKICCVHTNDDDDNDEYMFDCLMPHFNVE